MSALNKIVPFVVPQIQKVLNNVMEHLMQLFPDVCFENQGWDENGQNSYFVII